MYIKKVQGTNKDFAYLCGELENYQYCLLPGLNKTNYSLTNDLDDVIGFVLMDEKKPLASIGIKRVSSETCELVRVFVCEEYRKRGYATKLFAKIENLAKTLGYKKIELVVWCDATSAVSLYKKLGFVLKEEKISEYFGGFKYAEYYKNIC